MKRSDLEHIIRAAGDITGDDEIVVIGSQSILGPFPNAPAELLFSCEADVYPKNKPELAIQIEGAIGENSAFHDTFDYYAQGVGPETATLPDGWQDRLFRVANDNTRGTAGLCLEIHDLAISKYVAGREKDLEFTRALTAHGMVEKQRLLERLDATNVDADIRSLVEGRINRDFNAVMSSDMMPPPDNQLTP